MVHHAAASPEPDLFQIDVTVTNTGLAPATNLHYRRVFDWDIDLNDYSSYVTWAKVSGADDSFVHGTSNDGFADPNAAWPLTSRGWTGYFNDAGPDDHGGLIDITLGTLDVGESRTFRLYYGLSTSESDAMSALQGVGAEVYNLGQAATSDGPVTGAPVTAVFAIDGTGLRGAPDAAQGRRATAGPTPDGSEAEEVRWTNNTGQGGDG